MQATVLVATPKRGAAVMIPRQWALHAPSCGLRWVHLCSTMADTPQQKAAGQEAAPRPFVWPPVRPGASGQQPTEVGPSGNRNFQLLSPLAPKFPRFAAAVAEVERTWLGMTAGSLYERAVEAQWAPDAAASYCPRCGASVGTHEALDPLDAADLAEAGCKECRGQRLAWDRFVRLGSYDGLLREVVLEVKYSRRRRLGRELGQLLGAAIAGELTRTGTPASGCVLVPVPTHPLRRMLRGIDHTRTLCRGASGVCGVRVACVLARRMWGRSWRAQSRLSLAGRSRAVGGAMGVRRLGGLFGGNGADIYIIIDDVRTTGATLREACRVISKMAPGSGIWVASVACADDDL